MARPPKVTAASMRQAQNAKRNIWNAELLKITGPVSSAFVAKLEQALQLSLESPRPRTEVSAAHRFEDFQIARVVLGETFSPGVLLPELIQLFKEQVTGAFDKGRNFNVVFVLNSDNFGISATMTWN